MFKLCSISEQPLLGADWQTMLLLYAASWHSRLDYGYQFYLASSSLLL